MSISLPHGVVVPVEVEKFLASTTDSILIDGERRPAASGETLESFDPGTGAPLAAIAAGDEVDVDRAVSAAQRAFEDVWRDLKPAARGRLLADFAGLVEDHAEELATLETLDAGKPRTESLYIDAAYTAETLRYYAGWATKLHGDVLPVSPAVGEAFVYTRREPLGVVGAIVPWNFPMLITSWKIGPALAAGNTVVLKPSEMTSLTALRLAELALEAGLPPGVLNFVPPTIFTGVDDTMTIAREEIFGPVLSVLRFESDDDVITRANASRYGLAAGVWTRDVRRAHRMAASLQAGTVWINAYNMMDPTAPFGGMKESGYGRDLGVDAVRSYTHPKTVWVGLD